MFRNQYDTDVVTWSPQGRIHQVEYAMEGVKQGSAAVGLKSKTHVVVASLRRPQVELSSSLRKVFKIDDHLGIAISGLVSDGRSLCRYMRNECLNHKFVYDSPMSTARLVRDVADRAQVATQRSWKRPMGVGLLVAGYDTSGPRLFYNCPSGNYFDYKAFAIGARSQAAKTYLERKFESFSPMSTDELIQQALAALSSCLPEGELTIETCSIGLVGKDLNFTLVEGQSLQSHLDAYKAAEGAEDEGPGEGGGGEAAPMETS